MTGVKIEGKEEEKEEEEKEEEKTEEEKEKKEKNEGGEKWRQNARQISKGQTERRRRYPEIYGNRGRGQ